MIEDHKRLVSRVATFQSALDALLGSIMAQDERTEARLTALESRPCCNASPAASPAGSGGTTPNPSTATGAGSSATPNHPKSADAATASSDLEEPAPYGYCPRCDAKGVKRERRINGNDECENGHRYPSAHAASRPISRYNIPQSLRSVYQFTVNRMMHCMLNRHYDEGRFLEGLLNVLEYDYPTLAHREGRAIREVPR